MPISVSLSYALDTGTITEYSAMGSDGIAGYARGDGLKGPNDKITVKLIAWIAKDILITKNQTRLFGGAPTTGYEFTSCIPWINDQQYRCTLSNIDLSAYTFCDRSLGIPMPAPLKVYLYNDSGRWVNEEYIDVMCDFIEPTLVSLSITNGLFKDGKFYFGKNDEISFSYSATDKACDQVVYGCTNDRCVGFKEIKFYKNTITASNLVSTQYLSNTTDQCSETGVVTVPASSFPSGETLVVAKLFDRFDNSKSISEKSIRIVTDFNPPVIQFDSLKITDRAGKDISYFIPGIVLISFSVEIEEPELNPASVSADLTNLGMGADVKASCGTTSAGVTLCSWNNLNYNLDTNIFSKQITVKAKDSLGNEGSKSITLAKTLPKDTTDPTINGLRITSLSGSDLTGYIGTEPISAIVSVNITDLHTGVDRATIKANFTDINPSYIDMAPRSCIEGAATSTCIWEISIDLQAAGQVTTHLIFTADDKVGNSRAVALPYTFKVDATAPVVTNLKTKFQDSQGKSYLRGQSNTIIATLTESQSGIFAQDVFLDASSIGLSAKIPASSCEQAGVSWLCYWNGISTSRTNGEYSLSVVSPTKDKVGNVLSQSYLTTFIMDTVSPEVNYVTITPVTASTPVIPGYIQTGNALQIEASIYEPGGKLEAIADLSNIIQDAIKVLPDDCSQEGSDWTCIWTTSEIDVQGYIVDNLVFNFTDAAGNSEIHKEPIIILAPSDVETDYWDVVLYSPSPSAIDRELVSLYDPFMWFTVELVPKYAGVSSLWPVEVTIESCSGDDADYIASSLGNLPEIFNSNENTLGSFPYMFNLKYTFERASPDNDSLTIPCTLNIKTLVDGTTISQGESENITTTISYYNNPLGTLDKNIEKEIERVKGSWLVKGQWIETAQTFLGYAQMACGVMDKLKWVQQMFAGLKDGFSNCCSSFPNGVCCTAAMSAGKATAASKIDTKDEWLGGLNKYCKLLSCRLGKDELGDWSKGTDGFLKNTLEWVQNSEGMVDTHQGYFGNVDPQHSLVLSAVTLCLPGVIYNLQKARVIDCYYGTCLEQTKDGMPLYSCVDQRGYAMCKFVMGEIFNAIPFAAAIGQIGQNVQKALSHPFELVGFIVKAACTLTCSTPLVPIGQSCLICTIVEHLNVAMDVLCDLGVGNGCEPIWNQLSVDDSVCKQFIGTEEEETEE
jgi:hypothetical protein